MVLCDTLKIERSVFMFNLVILIKKIQNAVHLHTKCDVTVKNPDIRADITGKSLYGEFKLIFSLVIIVTVRNWIVILNVKPSRAKNHQVIQLS